MDGKIYFEYERMEPFKWPEPRDVRMQLEKNMLHKYKDQPISKITLSTEIILKSIKFKDGGLEKPLLKYKVINIDWEETRGMKNVKFDRKMFKWIKNDTSFNECEDRGD